MQSEQSPKSLAVAYAIKRRNNMAKGGMVSPKVHQSEVITPEDSLMGDGDPMCAHGGPVLCASGCYDSGGDVDEFGYADTEDHASEGSEQAAFDSENEDAYAQQDNQEGDPRKARLLSKVLGSIGSFHKGSIRS